MAWLVHGVRNDLWSPSVGQAGDGVRRMRNDIPPISCLPFESEGARSLHWLPLAVRHKLDGAALRLSLEQWQALPLRSRRDLLCRLPVEGFAAEARKAGARIAVHHKIRQGVIDEVEVARSLDCHLRDARDWLAGASSFALFAMEKRMRLTGHR